MDFKLVDQFGRPVQRTELTKLQAEPGLTGVRSAFRTICRQWHYTCSIGAPFDGGQ